jgi:hypothetical protein
MTSTSSQPTGDEVFEDFEAAEEIDAGPLRVPPHMAHEEETVS